MERDELEEIYKTYYYPVYLYALSLCQNIQEAEELTSDTFYKALLSLEYSNEQIQYWLLRVCKNSFLDRMRKKKKALSHLRDLSGITAYDHVLNRIIKDEETKRLYLAILSLPVQYREIIYMYYFLGYSGKEIAGLCGLSPGAVKTALCRARTKLRHCLGEDE